MMENMAQLEALCERLYNSQDSVERAHVENTLKCFSMSKEYISQCQYILENASTPYTLLLASSSLLKQVTEQTLPLKLCLDIWNYLINYLANRGAELQPFVIASLIQLLCRISKFGWLEDERFRDVVKESLKFMDQVSLDRYAIGMRILNQLVSEMNQTVTGFSFTQHRKIACSFRDHSLFQIFQISLSSLDQLKNDERDQLKELSLSLSLKCLSFDFIGTSIDESSDEFGTVQIPSSWRPVVEDPSSLQIFFDYYGISNSHLSKEALECLVRLASVRRSLFGNDAARSRFLVHLMTGTKEIMQSGRGLTEHDNFHEFCRLIGRFKANYQLSELIGFEGYADWIRLVAEFTMMSLRSWQWTGSSIYYLLGLWSRLVSSFPYLKGDSPSYLDEFAPQIAEEFIMSRLHSVQVEYQSDSATNALDNIDLLQDQLDCFPPICRFKFERCAVYIINVLEPLLLIYTESAQVKTMESFELSFCEEKLAWIVHIIAATIKVARSTGCSSAEILEVLDAELVGRVLKLIKVVDTGLLAQRHCFSSKQRLDRAILTFFQHLQKSYISDQAVHSTKLYSRLSELLGIPDHLVLLDVIIGKIAANLKHYTDSEDIIEYSLSLFLELASGYTTGKLLVKLDIVKFIISNHTWEHFPFLSEQGYYRCRTNFYYVLSLLIFMEDSPELFKSFMDPLSQVFFKLESLSESLFKTDEVKSSLIGLMRDLRGIAMATNSRRTYGLMFDWIIPIHTPLILKGISFWADTPEVSTPILKFMAEFVLNKGQRLVFDSSSPNGVLLFREASKIVVAYGTRVLALPITADIYSYKYKGIWICLTILSRALAGNFCNFGVLELYGDTALPDAINIALKMIVSVPLADILAYSKLAKAYYVFVELLFSHQIKLLLVTDPNTFMHVASSLESGLKGLDTTISSQCASAVDNLASFYFNNITSGNGHNSMATMNLERHVASCPNLFPELLKTLFEIVLFEDSGNQWSLSRPILSLILISEAMFSNLESHILASQQPERQQHISLCFKKLMTDITRSLDSKNRDRFTQNLTVFRHDFRIK